jgi:hypothetical protein
MGVFLVQVGTTTQLRIKAIEGYVAKGLVWKRRKFNSYGYNMDLPVHVVIICL